MEDTNRRRDSIIWGVWLVGLGFMLGTGSFWPGIMFVAAVAALLDGILKDQLWEGVQSAWVAGLIGLWARSGYKVTFLFLGLGLSLIVGAMLRPSPFMKPKPFVDSSMD